jgi:hypothetical protein
LVLADEEIFGVVTTLAWYEVTGALSTTGDLVVGTVVVVVASDTGAVAVIGAVATIGALAATA